MVAVRALLVLVVIGALAYGLYTWAKPHVPKHPPSVPHTVTINMPDPMGN